MGVGALQTFPAWWRCTPRIRTQAPAGTQQSMLKHRHRSTSAFHGGTAPRWQLLDTPNPPSPTSLSHMFVILRQSQPSAYVIFLPSLGILLTWRGQLCAWLSVQCCMKRCINPESVMTGPPQISHQSDRILHNLRR